MLTIEHTLEVEAPAARVWEVVCDLGAYPDWNPFVVACVSTLEVGEPISMRVRVLPFFAQPQREWILEHTPGRCLAYGMRPLPLGALASRRSHEVEPRPDAGSRYHSRFELRGWLAPLVAGLLGRRLEQGFGSMSRALVRRAEVLESGPILVRSGATAPRPP